MKIKRKVSFDVVVQAWLRAEWDDSKFDTIREHVPESLINGEHFDNPQDNLSRLKYLYEEGERHVLIEPLLPFLSRIEWYSASFEREDIKRTYLVSDEWNIISNYTHRPLEVMKNLHLDDDRAEKINAIKSSLSQKTIDRRLILVGTDIDSLLTILEGNHRAVAIFKDALDRNLQNLITDEVFVGFSSHMKDYKFHKKNMLLQAHLN